MVEAGIGKLDIEHGGNSAWDGRKGDASRAGANRGRATIGLSSKVGNAHFHGNAPRSNSNVV